MPRPITLRVFTLYNLLFAFSIWTSKCTSYILFSIYLSHPFRLPSRYSKSIAIIYLIQNYLRITPDLQCSRTDTLKLDPSNVAHIVQGKQHTFLIVFPRRYHLHQTPRSYHSLSSRSPSPSEQVTQTSPS